MKTYELTINIEQTKKTKTFTVDVASELPKRKEKPVTVMMEVEKGEEKKVAQIPPTFNVESQRIEKRD